MTKAVFLDRDGVINEVLTNRVRFVNKPSEFHLLPGVGEAIARLNKANYCVFVVTNQGGVGLGFLREEMLINIHQKMVKDLKKFGANIDEVAYCAHKPKEGCLCRKPGSKMITDLAEKHGVNLAESFLVGDRDVDIQAGRKAGVRTIIAGDEEVTYADAKCNDLAAAVDWILTAEDG
jgi:D-glycero-D-manno-heptose 1,7-bisphosphate phosphatase